MTILQMEYFIAVAECGSFSKAAEKMFVSQQGISRQIAAVEQELDMTLIDRSNRRRIVLTKEGEILFAAWKRSMAEYQDGMTEAMIAAGKLRKKLRIGIFEAGPIADYVMPLINGYRAHEPETEVECVFGSEEFIMNGLEDGTLDIVFALCGKYRDYIIYSYPIYYDRVCIALSKRHPLAERDELRVPDLEGVPLYVLNSSYSYDANSNIRDLLRQNGCSDADVVEVKDLNNLEMLLHMAEGVTFAPRILLRNTSDEIRFFPTEDEKNGDSIILYAIWKDEKMKNEVMEIIGIRGTEPSVGIEQQNML